MSKRSADAVIKELKLREDIAELIAHWAPKIGVTVNRWSTRPMRLYWASVNERLRKITFNSELADMPAAFLTNIVVHELVHLRTDGHDTKFYKLMDKYLPGWRKLDTKYSKPATLHS